MSKLNPHQESITTLLLNKMNHLIAKIKNNRKNPIKLVVSGKSIFNSITLSTSSFLDYKSDHNLDEDSWFKVNEFSKQSYFLDFLNLDFDSKEYQSISKTEFKDICYLCSIQEGDFYFQKVSPSLFLQKNLLSFGELIEIETSKNKIIINNIPDAIYIKSKDQLIFKNISTISSIFQGIDQLYKEATNEQVVEFLQQPFIKKAIGFEAANVSKPNRKRIALALETLSKLSQEDKIEIFSYIHSYCNEKLSIDLEESCCVISNDEELKNLIYGIEQRFYTTPFSKEKRLANSVQTIS